MFDFKGLLHSLVHRTDLTSTSTQSATWIAKNLPEERFFGTLIEIVKALANTNQDPNVPVKERIKTVLYVDDKAHELHAHLCKDWLEGKSNARNLLPGILAYWEELTTAYALCSEAFISQSIKDKEIEEAIFFVLIRGIHHQMQLIKWNAFRYLEPDETAWHRLYRFFALSTKLNIHRSPLLLYPQSHTPVTCEQLLLRACMLYLAQTENLVAREIQAIDQILEYTGNSLVLQQVVPEDDPVYTLNITQPKAPTIFIDQDIEQQGQIYWSGKGLKEDLQALSKEFRQNIPQRFRSTRDHFSLETWQGLLHKLKIRWSKEAGLTLRRAPREKSDQSIIVHAGFERIAFLMKVKDLQPNIEQNTPDWHLQDISELGCGLNYHGASYENLGIGKVLLVTIGQSMPKLGVIRRMIRKTNAPSNIGIEWLGSNPLGVTISDPQEDEVPFPCLYISKAQSLGGETLLFIPPKLALKTQTLEFNAMGKTYKILLRSIRTSFDDCCEVMFEVLK
jgi:hypothetical protein